MSKITLPGPVDRYFIDFLETSGDRILTKWLHYLPVYTRELSPWKAAPISFLEIGVFRGGSLPLWKGYFHPESTLVFIDIDPDCKKLEIDGTHVRIGNQADPGFLAELAVEFGPFDVVLDDGSHVCAHQVKSFEALWPYLAPQALYIVEDTHTSYWPGFGGGYRNEASFIEYGKRLLDRMHSWYTEQDEFFPFDEIATSLDSIRFYDSIVAIEKRASTDIPTSFQASHGKLRLDKSWRGLRGRQSVFKGRDGG